MMYSTYERRELVKLALYAGAALLANALATARALQAQRGKSHSDLAGAFPSLEPVALKAIWDAARWLEA